MTRLVTIIGVVLLSALAASCQSDVEALQEHCEELERTVNTEYACERMGTELGPLAEEHAEWMQRLQAMEPPADAEKKAWSDALAPCMRARLEASSGVCRHEPSVVEALEAMSSK